MLSGSERRNDWRVFVSATVVLLSSCCPLPARWPLFIPPPLSVPAVALVDPTTPKVVVCLDRENVDKLYERDVRTEAYIQQLRALLAQCR
jgi:hypothetical protein